MCRRAYIPEWPAGLRRCPRQSTLDCMESRGAACGGGLVASARKRMASSASKRVRWAQGDELVASRSLSPLELHPETVSDLWVSDEAVRMAKMEAKLEGMVHQLSSFNPRSYSGHKRPMLPVHPATCALPPANLSLVRGNLGTGLRGSVAACTACGSRSSGGDGSPSSAAVVASGTRPSACAGPSGMSNVDSSDDGPVSPRAALASYLLPPPLPRGLCLQRASLSSGTFPCFGRSDSARSRSNSAPVREVISHANAKD